MTLRALFPVTQQFQNKNGSNLVGGKVYIYYQGRTALATTYHDEEGTVVNANPVLLDNNGRATVFADTIYSYTIVVCDYYGKELFSQDITLHDAISTAEDVIVMGSNGSVKVDTTTLPNGVQYDLSVNTDIIATKKSVDDVKTDLNTLTGTVNNHTTQIGQIQEDIVGIESTVVNKKDKQTELAFNGSATKTVKKITQNANGELNVEFEDINYTDYNISSSDDSINVSTSEGVTDLTLPSDVVRDSAYTHIDAATANPLMNGTAAVGVSTKYAREDHVHPSDASRASASHTHGSITNDGKIGSTADLAVVTGTSGAVTTADLTTASPTVPTGGTTTSIEFIDTVDQDSKGKISATKKAVTVDSTYSSTGTNPVNGKAIAAAIGGLDSNKTSTDGVNVQVKVTETDGKISAVNVTTDNTENKNNKVSKWQTTPDNTHYPSEKLVNDAINAKADLTNSVAIFDGYVRRLNEGPGWRRLAYKQFNYASTNLNALFRLYLFGSNNEHVGLGDLIVNIRFNASGSAPELKTCYLIAHKSFNTLVKVRVIGVAGNAVVELWFKPLTFSMLTLTCLGNGLDVTTRTKDWTFEKYIDATDPEPVEDIANNIYVFSGTAISLQTKLTFDSAPTAGSKNPVTSDGIKKALDSRIPSPTSTTGTQVLKCIDGVIQWVTE